MTLVLTEEQVTEAFEAVVREAGEDYVYQEDWCKYFSIQSGKPMCVVGQVFYRLGFRPLQMFNQYSVATNSDVPNSFCLGNGIEIPESLGLALAKAQEIQDGSNPGDLHTRGTWGEALAKYKAVLAG